MSERLNKYLAFHLGISRREADLLIEKGSVTVNGSRASLGGRLEPSDTVTVRGKVLEPRSEHTYLMLNKPAGYVSSRRQQGETPTLFSLLPKEYQHLKTVGRLDKDSSGLILLSDDGDFTYQMTHPKFYKVKVYEITLDKPLEPLHQQMIADVGIQLEDGPSKLSLERLDDGRTRWQVTMHEGRNRQIRRTFGVLGYEISRLHRVQFGTYTLGGLAPSDHRPTSQS